MFDDKVVLGFGVLAVLGVIGLVAIKYMIESALKKSDERSKILMDLVYTVDSHKALIRKIEVEFERIEKEIEQLNIAFATMEKRSMQERFDLKEEISHVSSKVSTLIEKIEIMFKNSLQNHR